MLVIAPLFLTCVSALAQNALLAKPSPVAASAPTVVPALVPYSAIAERIDGTPINGEKTMTFLLFRDETGGEPLWTESQTVSLDAIGHYKVQLGASSTSGLPIDLFASGEGRWLEIQIAGEKPQPRVLLTSVPYALKAADAATLGGLPASAYMLAGSKPSSASSASSLAVLPGSISPDASSTVTTTGGTSGYIPKFTGSTTIVSSEIYDTGTSVGIGVKPNSSVRLDVGGSMIMRGNMIVSRTNNATSSQGFPSYGFAFYSNVYNSSTHGTDNPNFVLQSEPVGNNSDETGATFNLLYSNHGIKGETGISVNGAGQLLVGGGAPLGNGDGQMVVNSPDGQTSLVVNGRSAAEQFGGDALMALGGAGQGEGDGGGVAAQFFAGEGATDGTYGDGVDAYSGPGGGAYAGYFGGNVEITGTLNGATPEAKIDDPVDPANKYMVHASVGSSEMMNLYTGNVVTDDLGLATVKLPAWFETVNTDFRYQLTVIGRFAQAVVSKEIADHKFVVMTNAPHVKVSWQVTAVRQDPYAKAHPLVVEQFKPAAEKGFYMHPELYGQPEEKQTAWGRHPEAMRRAKAVRAAQKAQLATSVKP
jgi:hypothetical protein